MSLRARLVVVLGSLVALLLAAEWSLVRALTRELDQEVDVVALTVGSSMLSLFAPADGDERGAWSVGAGPEPPPGSSGGAHVERRVVVHETREPREPLFMTREAERATLVRAFEARPSTGPAGAPRTDQAGAPPHGDFEVDGDLELWVLRADAPEQFTLEGRHVHPTEGSAALEGALGLAPRAGQTRLALRIGSHMAALPAPIAGMALGEGELPPGRWTQHVEFHYEGLPPALARAVAAAPSDPAHGELDRAPSAAWSTAATGPVTEPPGASSLRIPVPRGGLDRAVDRFLSQLLLGSIALFVLGLGAIAWVAHRVTRPLRSLADAAERVGRGELGTVVHETGDGDVTKTLRAFNAMSLRLAALDEEAQRLRDREHLGELGDVARGLAHALRNPLHTLGLAVDALGTGRDDARETVRAARTQIQRIDGALEGFLTLAGAGGIREEVPLDDLARDVALELAQSTRPCAVRVLAEGGPVPIECVPAELRAVVHALVVNAAEAAPGDPVVVRVERIQDPPAQPLTGQRVQGGARVRLEVLDRGPGLPPEVRARLFTPHSTTKAQGTGMGLYLAERIARTRYGGSLVLHDRPGGGVRAVLELALHAAPEAMAGATHARDAAGGAA